MDKESILTKMETSMKAYGKTIWNKDKAYIDTEKIKVFMKGCGTKTKSTG